MQMNLSREARTVAAKMPGEGEAWLPLWVHAADTAGVLEWLYRNWLNDAGRKAISEGMTDGEAPRLCRYLGLAHDLGKCTPAFQFKITQANPALREQLGQMGLGMPRNTSADEISKSPHALAGAALLMRENEEENETAAAVVGAHHGRPWADQRNWQDQFDAHGNNYDGSKASRAAWRRVQREFMETARRESGYAERQALPELSVTAQMLLTGLLIMADWIASNTDYFPLISLDTDEADIPARLGEGLRRLALPPSWESAPVDDPERLSEKRFGFAPNDIQRAMMEAVMEGGAPGILILEAPMGIGKTEAALLAAEAISGGGDQAHRGGIFFGLPTQATADGIFERVEKWGQSQVEQNQATIRLAHGLASMNEAYARLMEKGRICGVDADGGDGIYVHEWMRGRKQALLSDFVVGTVDQVLMASLCQKHVMLRHLGLCGKVVIIDECHAYDAYMNCYLHRMLSWLGTYHTPVIMLSATLPYARRAELVDAYLGERGMEGEWRTSQSYPLLTWTVGKKVLQRAISVPQASRRVSVEAMEADSDAAAQAERLVSRLRDELSEGGCAAVVANTVRRAQCFARVLAQEMPDAQVMLLHAQFLAEDRKEKERELLRRVGKRSDQQTRNRLIVVGTQVIEQSLDIDLDLLITDLCPMDLLLQRIGRLHRHRIHDAMRPERLKAARCLVMGARGNLERGACAVYGEYLLMRTRALLPETVRLPEDISPLVQAVYDEAHPLPALPEGYQAAHEKEALRQRRLRQDAQTFLMESPHDTLANTLSDIMDVEVPPDDEHTRAAVRSGDPGLEVLLLVQGANGDIHRVSWRQTGERWTQQEKPDEGDCRRIAAQRIRLPGALSTSDAIWAELEQRQEKLAAWHESPWLKSEKILLLDAGMRTELCGHLMEYSREWGFRELKEER